MGSGQKLSEGAQLRLFFLTSMLLLLLLTAASTAVAAASQGALWLWVFGAVLLMIALILAVAFVVLLGLVVGMALLSPNGSLTAFGRTVAATTADGTAGMKRLPSLQLDESVVVSKVHTLYELPPMLYVDDYNVITEVPDVRTLQEGDHCVVGLNVLHNMLPWTDAVISRLTSWEALPLRFYHHFIIIDSVAALSADGLPLAADGTPARIVHPSAPTHTHHPLYPPSSRCSPSSSRPSSARPYRTRCAASQRTGWARASCCATASHSPRARRATTRRLSPLTSRPAGGAARAATAPERGDRGPDDALATWANRLRPPRLLGLHRRLHHASSRCHLRHLPGDAGRAPHGGAKTRHARHRARVLLRLVHGLSALHGQLRARRLHDLRAHAPVRRPTHAPHAPPYSPALRACDGTGGSRPRSRTTSGASSASRSSSSARSASGACSCCHLTAPSSATRSSPPSSTSSRPSPSPRRPAPRPHALAHPHRPAPLAPSHRRPLRRSRWLSSCAPRST